MEKNSAEWLLEQYDDATADFNDCGTCSAMHVKRVAMQNARDKLLKRMNEHNPVAVAAMNLAEKIDEFWPGGTAHSDFLKELREYRIARGPTDSHKMFGPEDVYPIDDSKIIGEDQQ